MNRLVVLFLLVMIKPAGADVILDSASGSPNPLLFQSIGINDTTWAAHRFNIAAPGATISTISSFFSGDDATRTAFAAIVELSSDSDIPDSFDLTTPDVLATTTFDVPAFHFGGVVANFPVTIGSGWHALVIGFGSFGADSVGGGLFDGVGAVSLPNDLVPDQLPFSIFTPSRSTLPSSTINQNQNTDFEIEGSFTPVPEPAASLLFLAAGTAICLRQVRRKQTA